MNRVVLFSDVHGNIVGLREIFREIVKLENVMYIVCCGDYFGYDAGADDVFDLFDKFNVIMLKGDHEEYLVKLNNDEKSKMPHQIINETYDWLRLNLSQENFNRLLNLKTNCSIKLNHEYSLYACHAGPDNLSSRTCATDVPIRKLRETYSNLEENIVVFGHHHTHHILLMDNKLLINCASVGMRKNDDICSYTIIEYDEEKIVILQKSFEYNIDEAEKLAVERGIPRL